MEDILGEVSALALLLGLFYMLWKKIILAHSGIYSGDGIRVLRYHVSGQSNFMYPRSYSCCPVV